MDKISRNIESIHSIQNIQSMLRKKYQEIYHVISFNVYILLEKEITHNLTGDLYII